MEASIKPENAMQQGPQPKVFPHRHPQPKEWGQRVQRWRLVNGNEEPILIDGIDRSGGQEIGVDVTLIET